MAKILRKNMFNLKAISISFLLFIIGCQKPMNELGRDKVDLIRKLKTGDIKSYHQLKILYLDYEPQDFIPFAKYMADSVNYAPANLDVFEAIITKYNFDENHVILDSMSPTDRNEAMLYLARSRTLKVDSVSKYSYITTR